MSAQEASSAMQYASRPMREQMVKYIHAHGVHTGSLQITTAMARTHTHTAHHFCNGYGAGCGSTVCGGEHARAAFTKDALHLSQIR